MPKCLYQAKNGQCVLNSAQKKLFFRLCFTQRETYWLSESEINMVIFNPTVKSSQLHYGLIDLWLFQGVSHRTTWPCLKLMLLSCTRWQQRSALLNTNWQPFLGHFYDLSWIHVIWLHLDNLFFRILGRLRRLNSNHKYLQMIQISQKASNIKLTGRCEGEQ